MLLHQKYNKILISYSAIFLAINLFVSCNKKIPTQNTLNVCPIKSEYCFIDIHEELNSCNKENEAFYGKSVFHEGRRYGYENIAKIEFSPWRENSIKDAIYSSKAVHIEFNDQMPKMDFAKFSNLEFLKLTGIPILPKEIFDLIELEVLVLGSKILEEIPDDITKLHKLRVLDIYPADGVKTVTSNLGELEEIEILTLNRFYSIKNIEIDFSKMTKLKRLDLWDNKAIDVDESILKCEDLYYLETYEFKDFFADLKNLQILGLDRVLSDSSINGIAKLDNLAELYIHHYKLSTIAEELQEMDKLEKLGLSCGWNELNLNNSKARLKNIEYLSIHCDNLIELPTFQMPRLKYLNLVDTENRHDIRSVIGLMNYRNLEYLRLVIGDNRSGLDLKEIDKNGKINLMVY